MTALKSKATLAAANFAYISAAWLPSGAAEPVELTASIAKPRSLFISAVANPGLKSWLAGDVGTGVSVPAGHMHVCSAQGQFRCLRYPDWAMRRLLRSRAASATDTKWSIGVRTSQGWDFRRRHRRRCRAPPAIDRRAHGRMLARAIHAADLHAQRHVALVQPELVRPQCVAVRPHANSAAPAVDMTGKEQYSKLAVFVGICKPRHGPLEGGQRCVSRLHRMEQFNALCEELLSSDCANKLASSAVNSAIHSMSSVADRPSLTDPVGMHEPSCSATDDDRSGDVASRRKALRVSGACVSGGHHPATSVVSRDIVDRCPETWFTPVAGFLVSFRI
jgi:hypothetical protein